MPEILLMRHAKSDWDASFGDDRDRPLNRRGINSARAMGRALRRSRRVPDAVLTSPAVRARRTAEIAADAGDWETPIEVVDSLYGGGVSTVIAAIAAAGSDRVMAVGHEPTWSATVAALIGGGRVRMATGTVAAIEVPSMARLQPGSGRLLWMLTPRLFTDGDSPA